MKTLAQALICASISMVSISMGAALAKNVQMHSQSYNPLLVPRTTVVDSWMEPTTFKTTQIIDAQGEKRLIAEPLIMERHERVILPAVLTKTNKSSIVQRQVESAVIIERRDPNLLRN
ncbi:MAG: hypothetical protein K2X81_09490 [Candidatus Obscuribacterales bacterium]|nr:hypothetical protein [Candidatus Obscuribacterales bacterium]